MKEPTSLQNWVHLYIGCPTNMGRLVGLIENRLFIKSIEHGILEYHEEVLGKTVFLYLRRIGDITAQESKQLIDKGFSIGRPSGYSFSNDAVLFLLSLFVDLFGMINAGVARDINTINDPAVE